MPIVPVTAAECKSAAQASAELATLRFPLLQWGARPPASSAYAPTHQVPRPENDECG